MKEVIVVGKGPAGISAALYVLRAGHKVCILASGEGALGKTDWIDNYYGFAEPVSGAALLAAGLAQAQRLGAQYRAEEVVGLGFAETGSGLVVKTTQGAYGADAAVLATGVGRRSPKIAGLSEREGKGVSYCAVCDGFFYRGKQVGVLGSADYALAEVRELLPLAAQVHLLTDGAEPAAQFPPEVQIHRQKITALSGEQALQELCFADGSTLALDGLFVALGVAGSSDLAAKLGALTEEKHIVVNEDMATSVPGLYAAGDCTGGLLQIAKAVHEGAKAGLAIGKYLRKPR